MKKRISIQYLLLLIILLIPFVSSSATINNCFYDANPHYDMINKITWVCEVSSATSCISYVKDTNKIIQTNPNIDYKENFGEISTFDCLGTCNIEFDVGLLQNNYTYAFGVICENSTFEKQVTPQLYLYEQQAIGRSLWATQNFGYMIGGIVIVFFVVIVIVYIKNNYR